MITIDMECSNGHVFEGWFDSLDAFEEQKANGLITCPVCDDSDIRRVFSPVAVRRSSGASDMDLPDIRTLQRAVNEFIRYVWKNSEDVGTRFAAEALKMHYGVTEKKSIRGVATEEEEKILAEEGIDFVKIPVPRDVDEDADN